MISIMSGVLGAATLANQSASYYGAGGGGGGSTSTIVTLQVSTISGVGGNPIEVLAPMAVSSLTGLGGGDVLVPANLKVSTINPIAGNPLYLNPNGSVWISSIASGNPSGTVIQNGLNFLAAASIQFDANVTAGATIAWNAGDGEMTGLSTINGVPFVAQPNGRATVANAGNIYVPAAGTTQPVAAFSTVVGHLYQLEVPNLRVQNQPPGQPVAGAWADITIDTAPTVTYLDTFDMASVSSIANDLQKAPVYSFVATATGHNLQANGILTNTLSTALTFAPQVFLRDLGAVADMPVVG